MFQQPNREKGRKPLARQQLAAIAASVLLCAASTAYAHGEPPGHIDRGPGIPLWITIVMVVSWIVIAIGIVLFVFRLIRQKGPREQGDKQEKA